MTTVTKSKLADYLGVHRSRVSALIKRGLPFSGRTIELDVAVAWLKANVSQQAGWQDRGIHRVLNGAKAAKPQKHAAKARPSALPPARLSLGHAKDFERRKNGSTAQPFFSSSSLPFPCYIGR
jgi:hypothetical protein